MNAQNQTQPDQASTQQPADPDQPEQGLSTQEIIGSTAITLGIGMLALILLRNLVKRRKMSRAQPHLAPDERLESIRHDAEQRARVESYGVRTEEIIRDLVAKLDNRIAAIEKLIEDADDRLRRLQSSLPSSPSSFSPSDIAQPHSSQPLHAETSQPQPVGADVMAQDSVDPVNRQIFNLADEGLSPIEIAQNINQHVGKVELILALRQR